MFKVIAKLNKWLLPNYTKNGLDLAKATKFQKAIIAWKYYVTTRALEQDFQVKNASYNFDIRKFTCGKY